MTDMQPPSAALRQDIVVRTLHGRSAPVRSCGFMLKPTAAGGYQHRVMDEFIAVYVMRGGGTFTDWEARMRRVGAGDLVLLPAGKRHGVQQDADGNWAEAYITMDGRFGSDLQRLGVVDSRTHVLHPGVNLALVQQFERIHQDLSTLPDYALPSVLVLAHELLNMASGLHRKAAIPDQQQRVIEQACVVLSQGLEKDLDMSQLADEFGLSYERFRKLFRQRVGVAPGDYRIRRRIDRARALIWQHRMSNKQVAYELGYPDPFTFSKQFRKVTGNWPDEYRRSLGVRV